jgi:putative PIG3 family NAD(P)H quinone oxidoreductase
MRAVRAIRPGGPEVLEVCELAEPQLRPGEVLVEVAATALNRADLLQRRGLYPPPEGVTDVLGLECAGTIIDVADGVPRARVGDRVMALLSGGGYAERVTVPERQCMPIPKRLTFREAAAIPEVFLTAHEALFTLAQLAPGERVLIHAAAGGVGSAAVQMAHAAGAVVFATAGTPEKCALATSLGAVCFQRDQLDFADEIARRVGGVDVVLDFVGAAYFARHCRVLAEDGRLVSIGLLGGARVELDLSTWMRKRLKLLGLMMRNRSESEKIALTLRFCREMLPRFETGDLRPIIDTTFALADVREAHARLESNANLGKIVLEINAVSGST